MRALIRCIFNIQASARGAPVRLFLLDEARKGENSATASRYRYSPRRSQRDGSPCNPGSRDRALLNGESSRRCLFGGRRAEPQRGSNKMTSRPGIFLSVRGSNPP
ncbi:hypothetical protein PUN28_014957 [Cardiocondyla obscurior]|uniref:Uncharacterized protein n=1 Tax=Cardiocondyla obscurior TaxID=286306 RepID=A0AAW2EXJ2_9HYME